MTNLSPNDNWDGNASIYQQTNIHETLKNKYLSNIKCANEFTLLKEYNEQNFQKARLS